MKAGNIIKETFVKPMVSLFEVEAMAATTSGVNAKAGAEVTIRSVQGKSSDWVAPPSQTTEKTGETQ